MVRVYGDALTRLSHVVVFFGELLVEYSSEECFVLMDDSGFGRSSFTSDVFLLVLTALVQYTFLVDCNYKDCFGKKAYTS